MKYLLFLLPIGSLACDKSILEQDLLLMQAGTPPAILKLNCTGTGCICVDSFPYDLNSDGLKLAIISNGTITVDPVKEAEYISTLEAIESRNKEQEKAIKEAEACLRENKPTLDCVVSYLRAKAKPKP